MAFGRHFKTASTEARHGCTCKGTENVTRMTMAAFAIVEAVDGVSSRVILATLEKKLARSARTHGNDVAGDIIAKCQVTSDRNQNINASSGADTRGDHAEYTVQIVSNVKIAGG